MIEMVSFTDFEKAIKEDQNIVVVKIDSNKILCRPKGGCKSKQIIKIPKFVDPNISFISGFLIGDGHLAKDGFRIIVDIVSIDLLKILSKKFEEVFGIDVKIKRKVDKRPNMQLRWKIDFRSKPIWLLFNLVFGIPSGKKSEHVTIPSVVLEDEKCRKMFFSGLFLADGGRKGKRISFTTISEKLFVDVQHLLQQFEIRFFTKRWTHTRHGRKVFDIVICRKDDINKFISIFPLVETKFAGVA